ncbi:L,D-transpeptidase family protein [Desulfovibrio sp. OttesenSCG-928-G15]|nr:L,D-transpeptidase family protein [Desulfovibrio sp. OttesenSCG-928-G15]
MKNMCISLCAVCLLVVLSAPAGVLAAELVAPEALLQKAGADKDRLLVVQAKGTAMTLQAYEKTKGKWSLAFASSGFIGKGGLGRDKKEGDGKTPVGVFTISRAFGIKENPGSRLPYTQVTQDDYWVDDPASVHYNTWAKGTVANRDWKSAEHLITETVAYAYAAVIDYNTSPIVRGAGSAIFLHCSKGRPTAGCVSVPEKDMIRLLKFLQPGDAIAIVDSAP